MSGNHSVDGFLCVGDDCTSSETFSFFRVTATGAATNKSADVVFTEGPLGTGEFRYNIVDSDGPEMRLNADGDVTITVQTAQSAAQEARIARFETLVEELTGRP